MVGRLRRERSCIGAVGDHEQWTWRVSSSSEVRIAYEPWLIASDGRVGGQGRGGSDRGHYGWYWSGGSTSRRWGSSVHLAHESGVKLGKSRVKNDERDECDLDRLVAPGAPGGGVDSAASDTAGPRVGALSRQARPVAFGTQGTGACGDGQRGSVAAAQRHVRKEWANACSTRCNSRTCTRCVSSRCVISSRSMTVKSRCRNARSTSEAATIGEIR